MTIRTHIFGWLTPHLMPILARQPDRLVHYVGLSRADWHFLGLVVACLGDKARCPDHFAAIEAEAFVAPRLEVLRSVYDGPARPLLKTVPKLRGKLWEGQTYRHLAGLAREETMLTTLRRQRWIDRRFLRGVAAVPVSLRSDGVLRRVKRVSDAEQLAFMVEVVRRVRTDMSEAEILRSLAQHKGDKADVSKWVSEHYQHAPFPAAPWDGDPDLVPISDYPALKRLALEFDNCVRNYHEEVIGGQSYFYRFAPGGKPVATVELQNLPQVGWSIGDVEGLKNARVGRSVVVEIRRRFGRVGIGSMPRDTRRWDLFRTV